MSERIITQTLHRIADGATPARLPVDLWSRGRRRHLRQRAGAVVAVVVLVGTVSVPVARGLMRPVPAASGKPPAAVPAEVLAPFPLQRSVSQAPNGPAALLVSGDGPFRGSDALGGYENHSMVVGRDGTYRLVRSLNEKEAGEGLLLSPDGRLIATDTDLEGVGRHDGGSAILDLTNGRTRTYRAGSPVAWSPDGRRLLTRTPTHEGGGWLWLTDLDSGTSRKLWPLGGADPPDASVAFSPDGRQFVVQHRGALHVVDSATGSSRQLVELGPRRRLAGPGAWRPDGRITVWELNGCESRCDLAAVDARRIRLGYLEATRGTEATGPVLDELTGIGGRILGWQQDGDAVVALFHPDQWPEPVLPGTGRSTGSQSWQESDSVLRGAVELLALHPGGGRTTLVTLPPSVHQVEVALDLLRADRFGGPPLPRSDRLADWAGHLVEKLLAWALGISGLIVLWSLWRRRPRRAGTAGRRY